MEKFATKKIFSVNGLPSSGKHEFVKKIKEQYPNAPVVELSEEDRKDFCEIGKKLFYEQKNKKIVNDLLAKSLTKYNRELERALEPSYEKVVITVNDPAFLFILYQNLESPFFAAADLGPYAQEYEALIEPHHMQIFAIQCEVSTVLENWIKKNGEDGLWITFFIFWEMLNNFLCWIHLEPKKKKIMPSGESKNWPYSKMTTN